MANVTLDEIYATCRRLDAEGKRIDDGLVAALRDLISKSGNSVYSWAVALQIPILTLMRVLDGLERPNGHFWDQIRRFVTAPACIPPASGSPPAAPLAGTPHTAGASG